MKVHLTQTELPDLVIVDVDHFSDERGFFLEAWNRREFAEAGLDVDFVQDNHSRSSYGVLRGMHYQDMTAPLGKLVRCTLGAIYDVAVDLRAGSPSFGKWFGIELSADNKRQLYVPVGFAHGFAAIAEHVEVQYKQTGYYAPSAEGVLRWDDPSVGIEWPVENPLLSKRDQGGISLEEYLRSPAFTS